MRNPRFQAHLTAWGRQHGLEPCNGHPCAHSLRGGGYNSAVHRDYCIGRRRALLANPTLFKVTDAEHRVLLCFVFAARPDEPGHDLHRANVERYAALAGVQVSIPSQIAMHRLFSTDSTAVIYGPTDADLSAHRAGRVPTWNASINTWSAL